MSIINDPAWTGGIAKKPVPTPEPVVRPTGGGGGILSDPAWSGRRGDPRLTQQQQAIKAGEDQFGVDYAREHQKLAPKYESFKFHPTPGQTIPGGYRREGAAPVHAQGTPWNALMDTMHAVDAVANVIDPDLGRTKAVAEWAINKIASGNYASAAAAMQIVKAVKDKDPLAIAALPATALYAGGKAFEKSFIENQRGPTYADVLETAGVQNKYARAGAGLLMDIFLDPFLIAAPFNPSKIGRLANVVKGYRQEAKFAGATVEEIIKEVEKHAPDVAKEMSRTVELKGAQVLEPARTTGEAIRKGQRTGLFGVHGFEGLKERTVQSPIHNEATASLFPGAQPGQKMSYKQLKILADMAPDVVADTKTSRFLYPIPKLGAKEIPGARRLDAMLADKVGEAHGWLRGDVTATGKIASKIQKGTSATMGAFGEWFQAFPREKGTPVYIHEQNVARHRAEKGRIGAARQELVESAKPAFEGTVAGEGPKGRDTRTYATEEPLRTIHPNMSDPYLLDQFGTVSPDDLGRIGYRVRNMRRMNKILGKMKKAKGIPQETIQKAEEAIAEGRKWAPTYNRAVKEFKGAIESQKEVIGRGAEYVTKASEGVWTQDDVLRALDDRQEGYRKLTGEFDDSGPHPEWDPTDIGGPPDAYPALPGPAKQKLLEGPDVGGQLELPPPEDPGITLDAARREVEGLQATWHGLDEITQTLADQLQNVTDVKVKEQLVAELEQHIQNANAVAGQIDEAVSKLATLEQRAVNAKEIDRMAGEVQTTLDRVAKENLDIARKAPHAAEKADVLSGHQADIQQAQADLKAAEEAGDTERAASLQADLTARLDETVGQRAERLAGGDVAEETRLLTESKSEVEKAVHKRLVNQRRATRRAVEPLVAEAKASGTGRLDFSSPEGSAEVEFVKGQKEQPGSGDRWRVVIKDKAGNVKSRTFSDDVEQAVDDLAYKGYAFEKPKSAIATKAEAKAVTKVAEPEAPVAATATKGQPVQPTSTETPPAGAAQEVAAGKASSERPPTVEPPPTPAPKVEGGGAKALEQVESFAKTLNAPSPEKIQQMHAELSDLEKRFEGLSVRPKGERPSGKAVREGAMSVTHERAVAARKALYDARLRALVADTNARPEARLAAARELGHKTGDYLEAIREFVQKPVTGALEMEGVPTTARNVDRAILDLTSRLSHPLAYKGSEDIVGTAYSLANSLREERIQSAMRELGIHKSGVHAKEAKYSEEKTAAFIHELHLEASKRDKAAAVEAADKATETEKTKTLIRGEHVTPSAKVNSSSWEGNIVEAGDYVSDGRLLVRTEDTANLSAVGKEKLIEGTRRGHIQAPMVEKIWKPAVKEATEPLEYMGKLAHGDLDMAVYRLPDGRAVSLNADKAALFQKITRFDELRAVHPEKAVVGYREGKPVGVIMPLRNEMDLTGFKPPEIPGAPTVKRGKKTLAASPTEGVPTPGEVQGEPFRRGAPKKGDTPEDALGKGKSVLDAIKNANDDLGEKGSTNIFTQWGRHSPEIKEAAADEFVDGLIYEHPDMRDKRLMMQDIFRGFFRAEDPLGSTADFYHNYMPHRDVKGLPKDMAARKEAFANLVRSGGDLKIQPFERSRTIDDPIRVINLEAKRAGKEPPLKTDALELLGIRGNESIRFRETFKSLDETLNSVGVPIEDVQKAMTDAGFQPHEVNRAMKGFHRSWIMEKAGYTKAQIATSRELERKLNRFHLGEQYGHRDVEKFLLHAEEFGKIKKGAPFRFKQLLVEESGWLKPGEAVSESTVERALKEMGKKRIQKASVAANKEFTRLLAEYDLISPEVAIVTTRGAFEGQHSRDAFMDYLNLAHDVRKEQKEGLLWFIDWDKFQSANNIVSADKKRAWIMPKAIADDINKGVRALGQGIDSEDVRTFWKFFDRANSVYKGVTIAWYPKYHLRNWLTNLWMMHIYAGVDDFGVHRAAGDLIKGRLAGKYAGYDAKTLLKLAEDNAVFGHGFYGDFETTFRESVLGKRRNPIQVGLEFGQGIENQSRAALWLDGLNKGLTPEMAAMRMKKYLFDYSELSNFEKQFLKRAWPFYTWTRKNVPLELQMMAQRPWAADFPRKAVRNLNEAISGGDIPAAERAALPDYLAEKQNYLIKGPSPYALVAGAMKALGTDLDEDPNEKRRQSYYSAADYVPLTDLFENLPMAGGLTDQGPFVRRLWSNVNPVGTMRILNLAMNYDPYLNRRIYDPKNPDETDMFIGKLRIPVQMIYLMNGFRGSNELDRMLTTKDWQEQKSIAAQVASALSFAAGVSPSTYDMKKRVNQNEDDLRADKKRMKANLKAEEKKQKKKGGIPVFTKSTEKRKQEIKEVERLIDALQRY